MPFPLHCLVLSVFALKFSFVNSVNYIQNLNSFIEEYSDCRTHVHSDSNTVGLEPFSSPVFISNKGPSMKESIGDLVAAYNSSSIHSTGQHFLHARPQLFCTTHFFVLYNNSIENYICTGSNPNWHHFHISEKVTFLLFVKDVPPTGNITRTECNAELSITILHLKPVNGRFHDLEFEVTQASTFHATGDGESGRVYLYPVPCLHQKIKSCHTPNFSINLTKMLSAIGNMNMKNTKNASLCFPNKDSNFTIISDSELNQYIGSPFGIKDLYHKTELYYKPEFWPMTRQAAPIAADSAMDYIRWVHMLASTKSCINASLGLSMDVIFYRLLPAPAKYSGNYFQPEIGVRSCNSECNSESTDRIGTSFIPLRIQRFDFVTCDGVTLSNSFRIYGDPYDLPTWISIGVVTLVLPLVLLVMIRLKNAANLSATFVSMVTTSVSLVVGAASQVSDSVLEVMGILTQFRLILGSMMLAMVVINNAYKGLFSSFVLAPARPAHKWTAWNELGGFLILIPNGNYYIRLMSFSSEEDLNSFGCDCLEIGIRRDDWIKHWDYSNRAQICKGYHDFKKEHTYILQRYLNLNRNPATPSSCNSYAHFFNLTDDLSYFKRTEPLNSVIPKVPQFRSSFSTFYGRGIQLANNLLPLLQTCDRSVAVDYEEDIREFVIRIRHGRIDSTAPMLEFSTASAGFLPESTGLVFVQPNSPGYYYAQLRMFQRLQAMIEHGIHDIWDKWFRRLVLPRTLELEKMEEALRVYDRQPKKLTLSQNVASAFLIWMSLIGASAVLMLSELVYWFYIAQVRLLSMGQLYFRNWQNN